MSRNFDLLRKLGKEHELLGAKRPARPPREVEGPRIVVTGGEDRKAESTARRGWSEILKIDWLAGQDVPLSTLEKLVRAEEIKLVQRVFLLPEAEERRLVLFCGTDADYGYDSVCIRAARILSSQTPASVCLVDANFGSPSLHTHFGVENSQGLTDALLRGLPLRECAQQMEPNNLWLIPAGVLFPGSNGFLACENLRSGLHQLRREFGYVLVYAPPLELYPDGIVLSKCADGVVLVLEANATRRKVAKKIKDAVEAAKGRVVGVVLNNRDFPIPEAIYRRL